MVKGRPPTRTVTPPAAKQVVGKPTPSSLVKSVAQKGKNKIDLKKIRKYADLLHVNIEPYVLTVTT